MSERWPVWRRVPGTIWSIAELKSAFQKCARQRDDRAYQIARVFLAAGPAVTRHLLRRLVTIAAEEGTLGVVPEASELLLRAYGQGRTGEQVTAEAVLRVVGRVIATKRDKDPTYLQNWPCPVDDRWLAERYAVALWKAWSVKRGLRWLQVYGEALPAGLARDVVLALHRRGRMGVLEGDLKIFCAIALALFYREARNEIAVLPIEDPIAIPQPATLTELPWWCFDPHTAVGKKALKAVLEHSPHMPWKRAFLIWFRQVSDQLEGYIAREGWREKRFAHEITDADAAWWREVEPIAQQTIEKALRARTPAPLRMLGPDVIVSPQVGLVQAQR